MSLPHEVKLSSNTLEIHVAGPGYGESVLIVIGNEIAIGIDCCPMIVRFKDRGRSYLDERLSKMASGSRLYWLITHFHLDHFNAFNTLLNLYEERLESVVVPIAYNEGDHYADILYQEMKEDTGMRGVAEITIDQLALLRQSLNRDSLKFKITESAGRVPWLNSTLVLPNNKRIPLLVEYYGVPHQVLGELRSEALKKVIVSQGDVKTDTVKLEKNERPYAKANEGSYIVHARIGRFEGLFLGDAESHRTEEILTQRGPTNAEVICLKVAHHGSDDGTTNRLLHKLCDTTSDKSERYAMIAPYQTRLPKSDVISMLMNSGFDVKTSGARFVDSPLMNKIVSECSPSFGVEVVTATAMGTDVITNGVDL